ncbi:MAG: right-handed parallel beta-helix repeat-containing protein, partial [Microgenomates group bacterium]
LYGSLMDPANGLVVTGGRVDVRDLSVSSFSKSTCDDRRNCKGGAGVMVLNNAKLHVENVRLEGNRVGISIFDNAVGYINNAKFKFNNLTSMEFAGNSRVEISNVTVEGGKNGIFFGDSTVAAITHTSFKRLQVKAAQLLQRSNVVMYKISIEDTGEGIVTYEDSKATITDVTLKKVQDNIAAIDKSQITITGLTIDGGNSGVSSHVESMITVARGDLKNISNNNVGIYDKSHMSVSRLVTSGGIAGVALDTNASAKVSNSTFYGNTEVGINLGCHGSVGRQSVDLVNNIVFGTKKQFNACGSGSAYNFGGKAAKQTIDVKDFRANWAFNSSSNDFGGFEKFTQWLASDKLNRVADPQFMNAAIGDFHLKPGSPALTAGIDGKEVGAFGQGDGPVEPLKQKTVITLVSQDGSTAYSRECEGQRGIVDTGACGQWVTYDLSAIRVGVPAGQTYSGISSIVYKEGDSTKVLLQSLLDKSSSKAWYRRCRFKAREDVHYRNCSDWSEVDTGTIEGITKKTIGIEGYIEATGHANYYVQSLLSDDGITAFSRTCELTNREILFRDCLRYKKVNLSGIRLAEDSVLTFTDLDSWYSSTHYNQSILLSDGMHYMFRSCTFGGSGVNFRQCSPFTKYSISDHDNNWNKEWRVAGIDSFTYEY